MTCISWVFLEDSVWWLTNILNILLGRHGRTRPWNVAYFLCLLKSHKLEASNLKVNLQSVLCHKNNPNKLEVRYKTWYMIDKFGYVRFQVQRHFTRCRMLYTTLLIASWLCLTFDLKNMFSLQVKKLLYYIIIWFNNFKHCWTLI